MKNTLFNTLVFAAFILLQSFVVSTPLTEENAEIKSSKIVWKAYKVTGSHEGTVGLESGSLVFEEGELTGGEFVLDMNSMACTDLSGEYKEKLEAHLKSDDFFGTANHATSNLKITEVEKTGKNSYNISGDLTIKGITKSIQFLASIYGKKATASLKIDRTAFDIKYGSGSFFDGLKNNMIYDEFDLVIDLEF